MHNHKMTSKFTRILSNQNVSTNYHQKIALLQPCLMQKQKMKLNTVPNWDLAVPFWNRMRNSKRKKENIFMVPFWHRKIAKSTAKALTTAFLSGKNIWIWNREGSHMRTWFQWLRLQNWIWKSAHRVSAPMWRLRCSTTQTTYYIGSNPLPLDSIQSRETNLWCSCWLDSSDPSCRLSTETNWWPMRLLEM